MFLTHYVQYIRPIMRMYRLRCRNRGCGVNSKIAWMFVTELMIQRSLLGSFAFIKGGSVSFSSAV